MVLNLFILFYSFQRIICESCGKWEKKILALSGIAECCLRANNFELASRSYLRALEYCWFINDKNKELEIYDKMGYLYFNQGLIDKAIYYHGRSVKEITECDERELSDKQKLNEKELSELSPYLKISRENLENYHSKRLGR